MTLDGNQASVTTRRAALTASIKAGLGDLKVYPGLATMTAVTVAVGTFLALLGPLVAAATEVGDEYVTMKSEILVLAPPDSSDEDLSALSSALAALNGVSVVRQADSSDLAALSPTEIFRFESGPSLVIQPTGTVPVAAIRHAALDVSGVEAASLGVGVPSQHAIRLVQTVTPWLAGAFLGASLLLVSLVAYMAARTRVEEAETMRLVGASTTSIWIRTAPVVVVPTLAAVLVTTALVAVTASSIAGWFVPVGATTAGTGGVVLQRGVLFALAALIITTTVALLTVWRVATR